MALWVVTLLVTTTVVNAASNMIFKKIDVQMGAVGSDDDIRIKVDIQFFWSNHIWLIFCSDLWQQQMLHHQGVVQHLQQWVEGWEAGDLGWGGLGELLLHSLWWQAGHCGGLHCEGVEQERRPRSNKHGAECTSRIWQEEHTKVSHFRKEKYLIVIHLQV